MVARLKSIGLFALACIAMSMASGKADAATTIYDVRVADNNGFTQIHGKVSVRSEMQINAQSSTYANISPAPFFELFGLSQLGEIHRAAFWLPWAMPVPQYAGGAAAGTRLYGAMSGIDTPLLFANFVSGDPSSIFANFPAGGGLVIAYAGSGQEDAFTYGNLYPTMILSRAPILSISSAVPEPGAWATMLLGFGLIGGAMRRRQKARMKFGQALRTS